MKVNECAINESEVLLPILLMFYLCCTLKNTFNYVVEKSNSCLDYFILTDKNKFKYQLLRNFCGQIISFSHLRFNNVILKDRNPIDVKLWTS